MSSSSDSEEFYDAEDITLNHASRYNAYENDIIAN